MRSLIFLLVAIALHSSLYSQANNADYQKAITKFESLYNNGNYDSLYYMFAPEMQNELPPQKTIDFLSATKSIAGKLSTLSLKTLRNLTLHTKRSSKEDFTLYIFP